MDSMLKDIEVNLYGLTENSIILINNDKNQYSKNYKDLIYHESVFLKKMDNIVKEFEVEYEEKQAHFKNLLVYSCIFIVLFLTFVIIFIFIPQAKRDVENKKNLENSIQELTLLNSTKNTFFKIIAHDLKNPFGTIMRLLELLKSNFNNFSKDEINTFIDKINEQSKSTYNLLTNLLEWAKIQSNDIEFKPNEVSLNEIFEIVNNETKGTAKDKGINLKFPNTENTKIFADPNMIMATFRNLISNSIKFSESNSEIEVKYEVKEDKIEFAIIDQGIGMSKETINELFRVENKKSTKGTAGELGSGLGLILSKEYIEKHEGEISVESELNKGSKFKFYIPIN